MKSIKVPTRFSSELARQSVVSLDAALKARLVKDVADKLDTQMWSASGDGTTTPQGLFAWIGTQTLAVDGPLTLDDLHDAEGPVLAANVDPSRVRWVMTETGIVKRATGDYTFDEQTGFENREYVTVYEAPVLVQPDGDVTLVNVGGGTWPVRPLDVTFQGRGWQRV